MTISLPVPDPFRCKTRPVRTPTSIRKGQFRGSHPQFHQKPGLGTCRKNPVQPTNKGPGGPAPDLEVHELDRCTPDCIMKFIIQKKDT
jgi:hypothetical protein